MDFLRPATWVEALDAKAQLPEATPIAGGTDTPVAPERICGLEL